MRLQQVLHHVQAFSAIEVCRLARQHLEFMRVRGLFKAFAALTRRRGAGNTLQFNDFGAVAQTLSDIVARHFTAEAVVRGDMAHHFALRCHAVQRDHRDIRLVSHFHRVADRIGIGWVDQQQFGAAHGEILHVSQLFRRVVLRVQHHQVIAQFIGLFLRPLFHRNKEGVVQRGDHQRQGIFCQCIGAEGRRQGHC